MTCCANVGGFSVPEIAEVFRSWKDSELDSYLIDITTEVLAHTDATTGEPFVDVVVDAAGQKGTGVWTTQTALELGVAVPAIAEATFARAVSSASAARAPSRPPTSLRVPRPRLWSALRSDALSSCRQAGPLRLQDRRLRPGLR